MMKIKQVFIDENFNEQREWSFVVLTSKKRYKI